MTTPTPTLGYANPAVIYAGVYRHRSAAAVLCMAALTCFGVAAGWAAYAGPMGVPLFRLPLYGLAAVLLLGVGYLAATAAADRQDPVRITEDGRRLWPWAQVGSVCGFLTGGTLARRAGVVIGFTADRFGVPFPHTLLATPTLTVGQCAQLAAALDAFLSRAHPHVAVDPQPRRSEG